MANPRSAEELERRRIARKESYRKIKENPQLYALEQAKKREYYLKRKDTKKVKSIHEMSPREQRAQRKKWKENAKRCYKKKIESKRLEMIIVEKNVNNDEAHKIQVKEDPLKDENPINRIRANKSKLEIKLIKKIRCMKIQHKRERERLVSLINKYRNQIRVLKNSLNKLDSNESSKEQHTKKESFQEILTSELTHKLASSRTREPKQALTNLIDKSRFKRAKLATELRKICLRKRLQKKVHEDCQSLHRIVEIFYQNDINSRLTAGRKQYKKQNGLTKQKRYLLDTVKNLHRKFLQEHPNLRISYSTFSRLRPFWVCFPIDDRDSCACTLHTNLNLLISALNKKNIIDIKDSQALLSITCCDKYDLNCVSRKCDICRDKSIVYREFQNDHQVEYFEWEKDIKRVDTKDVKIIKKNRKISDPRNLIMKMECMLPIFYSHTNNIINQYSTIKKLKDSLQLNEVLIHMDFSENYSYKHATEVQSMHFGGSRGQVCLHTAVIYLRNKTRRLDNYSVCSVSQCTRHDAAAVWAHLESLISIVFEKSPEIDSIHILTDGPTSQYRNKYIFYIITQLENYFSQIKLVTWNYQEAGHGKGAPDGVGAVVKRTADLELKFQRDVDNFPTFVKVIQENIKNVKIKVVEENEIRTKAILLPKDISTFRGTLKVHQVVWTSNSDFLEFRSQSCFQCLYTTCIHGKHMKYFKIMDSTATEPTVQFVSIEPDDGKKIKILSDITIRSANIENSQGHYSMMQEARPVSLSEIKKHWTNQTFVGTQTKAKTHQKEYLQFIAENVSEDE